MYLTKFLNINLKKRVSYPNYLHWYPNFTDTTNLLLPFQHIFQVKKHIFKSKIQNKMVRSHCITCLSQDTYLNPFLPVTLYTTISGYCLLKLFNYFLWKQCAERFEKIWLIHLHIHESIVYIKITSYWI